MTPSEAAALLAATGIEADPRDLATLARRSEGWPAALIWARSRWDVGATTAS